MTVPMVDKLLVYIETLESRISLYKDVLGEQEGISQDMFVKLGQYGDIVSRQHGLAVELKRHLAKEEWLEVCRHIQIIKGLSTMIRDDVQSFFAGQPMKELSARDRELLC